MENDVNKPKRAYKQRAPKQTKLNKRNKVMHFRVTETERNEIHTFCALNNTTIIELIYMSYGREFAELEQVKQVIIQGRKRIL